MEVYLIGIEPETRIQLNGINYFEIIITLSNDHFSFTSLSVFPFINNELSVLRINTIIMITIIMMRK